MAQRLWSWGTSEDMIFEIGIEEMIENLRWTNKGEYFWQRNRPVREKALGNIAYFKNYRLFIMNLKNQGPSPKESVNLDSRLYMWAKNTHLIWTT